jgi:hypothetical protein
MTDRMPHPITDTTEQVNIRVPADLLAWLRRRAEAERRSLAGTIKALLGDAMDAEAKRAPRRKAA